MKVGIIALGNEDCILFSLCALCELQIQPKHRLEIPLESFGELMERRGNQRLSLVVDIIRIARIHHNRREFGEGVGTSTGGEGCRWNSKKTSLGWGMSTTFPAKK